MPFFPTKTFTVPSSQHTYSYVRLPPTSPRSTTLLFLHGFPSHAASWHNQISHFTSLGYGILAPDLLGHGFSSTPQSPAEYRSAVIVPDLIAILDHEGVGKMHGVGHDAGSYVLSRLWNYHPDRFLSLTFIAVPYGPPGVHMDLGAMNVFAKSKVGFEKFGYIDFLASERSTEVIERHLERFLEIAYNSDVELRAREFYPPGKLEAWLERDDGTEKERETTLLNEEERKAWLQAYRKSGLRGATNGYRLMLGNLNEDEEKADVQSGRALVKIGVPVLGIDPSPDSASVPGFVETGTKPFLEEGLKSKFVTVGSQGHYPQIVSKDEVNQVLEEFLRSVEKDVARA